MPGEFVPDLCEPEARLHEPPTEWEEMEETIQPRLVQRPKEVTLRLRNGAPLTVRYLGEDYYGTHKGKKVWCPIYSYEALDRLVSEIRFALAHKWDQPIVIAGRERSGKSDFAMHLVHKLDPNFDLRKIAWTQEQFMQAMYEARPLDIVWMDEAGEAAFAQEWYTKEQRSIVKAFLRFGIKELTVILVIPHMMLLNKQLRERRVWWWIEVYAKDYDERGYAQIRKAPLKQNPFDTSVYWHGWFTIRYPPFKSINPEKWEEYEKIKWENLHRKDEEGEETIGVSRIVRKLLSEGRGILETASLLGLDVKFVREIAKEMGEKTCPR